MVLRVGNDYERKSMLKVVDTPGFKKRWVRNDSLRISSAEAVGWEIDKETKIDKTKGKTESVRGDLILMRIPEKLYHERVEEKNQYNKSLENQSPVGIEKMNKELESKDSTKGSKVWIKSAKGLNAKDKDYMNE